MWPCPPKSKVPLLGLYQLEGLLFGRSHLCPTTQEQSDGLGIQFSLECQLQCFLTVPGAWGGHIQAHGSVAVTQPCPPGLRSGKGELPSLSCGLLPPRGKPGLAPVLPFILSFEWEAFLWGSRILEEAFELWAVFCYGSQSTYPQDRETPRGLGDTGIPCHPRWLHSLILT